MDGDSSAKTMDEGARTAAPTSEMSDSLHETAKLRAEPMGKKTTGTGVPLFSSSGSIGKQFNADGAIGGTAQAVGGPFDKTGMIGKQFTEQGSIGGQVQEMLGKDEEGTLNK